VSKEIQDLIEIVEGEQYSWANLRLTLQWQAFLKAAKHGSFWPTPIAFADEKPKEGQSILYRQKGSKGWNHAEYTERYYDLNSVTHWLPAPPDLPEPKPAWEVAWEDYGTTGPILIAKTDFKFIWDRAQKEKA
jgi:hypothetical protein